jgi:hypothetical protein
LDKNEKRELETPDDRTAPTFVEKRSLEHVGSCEHVGSWQRTGVGMVANARFAATPTKDERCFKLSRCCKSVLGESKLAAAKLPGSKK